MTHHRLDFLHRPDPQYLDPKAEEGEGVAHPTVLMAERAALLAEHLGSVEFVDSAMGELYTLGDLELDESDEDE